MNFIRHKVAPLCLVALAAWNQILWRFSDNLNDVAPIEAFFEDFFRPGLVADIFAGARPVAPSDIAQKDRRQPVVELSEGAKSAGTLKVKVSVTDAGAGARDVRLFNNGSLVRVWRGDVLKGARQTAFEVDVPLVVARTQRREGGGASQN